MSLANMMTLLGCLIGYMASDLMIDLGWLSGGGASWAAALLPAASGLVAGLIALRLTR